MIFEIPGGVLADHFSKKQILLIGLLLQLIGEIVFLQGNQFFHFAIASLIGGIHWALHSGCLEAYLNELLRSQKEPERYSEALGYRICQVNCQFHSVSWVHSNCLDLGER